VVCGFFGMIIRLILKSLIVLKSITALVTSDLNIKFIFTAVYALLFEKNYGPILIITVFCLLLVIKSA
jgi:hypothetical protein